MAEKKKPERRKSALSNMSPVAPPPVQESAPASAPAPASASAGGEEVGRWPKKESFYRSPELAGRMRSAHLHTMTTEDGKGSLSAFIASAVEEKVERLEAKYNDGQPWPAVKPGQVPKGRPPGWTLSD